MPGVGGNECSFVVASAVFPHGKDNPDPDVRQSPQSFVVSFPLASLRIVILPCPGNPPDALEGKEMHYPPERFDAGLALSGKSVLAALRKSTEEVPAKA
jgi:hypothetical protein